VTGRREWLVELAALGEVPAQPAGEEAAALAAEVAALQRDDQEILAALPAEAVAREVARRAAAAAPPPPRRRPARTIALSAAACAAAATLVVVVSRPGGDRDGDQAPAEEVTRAKGTARLLLHRKRGETIEPLERTGATAIAGDSIQISYLAGSARHGVILSLDGAGLVTLHFPAAEPASTRLAPDGPIPLPHSYQLDDAPAFERFFFVTAAGPIDVKAVSAAARRLARDPARAAQGDLLLPPHMSQQSFLLHKQRTP
jgi:hypothetical protein